MTVAPWCIGCGLREHGVVRNGYKRRPRVDSPVFVHRWNGALIWYTYLDDDRLDLEILLAREVSGSIGKGELAKLLGVEYGTVHTGVHRGILPRPAYYDEYDDEHPARDGGCSVRRRARWTDAQAVDAVLARQCWRGPDEGLARRGRLSGTRQQPLVPRGRRQPSRQRRGQGRVR